MKQGTAYAARMNKAYTAFCRTRPKPAVPESQDPLRQLAIGVLGVACTETQAEQAVDRILAEMVDWNEVRVSRPLEVHRLMDDTVPDGLRRVGNLIAALEDIYDRENALSLDRLRITGRREARHYLEQLNGVDEYAAAMVFLWSLGGHAIPVNDRLHQALRAANLVHSAASRAEVQAFLERHVGAAEAKAFCINMRFYRGSRSAASKRHKSAPANKRVKKSI